jgi:hypothetical protein
MTKTALRPPKQLASLIQQHQSGYSNSNGNESRVVLAPIDGEKLVKRHLKNKLRINMFRVYTLDRYLVKSDSNGVLAENQKQSLRPSKFIYKI